MLVRCVDQLEQLPRLAALLERDTFRELVRRYVRESPSLSFAAWLARDYEPLWLGELAALESARVDVRDEIDENIVTMDNLAHGTVRLTRAHRLVAVAHAVEDVWSGADPPEAPGMLLVWRRGASVLHRRLGALEQSALAWTVHDIRLGALRERAGDLVGRWIAEGLLVT